MKHLSSTSFIESGIGRLIEAKDKEGKEWEVALIASGWSKNGKYYSSEVLKQAIPLFDGAKAFAFKFVDGVFNHLPQALRRKIPQGFIENIVGWHENPHFGTYKNSEGKQKEGILARFHVSDNAAWLGKLLKDAWESGKKNFLEFSIDGLGPTHKGSAEGISGEIVDEIIHINSVDPVSQGAAGGELVSLLASINLNKEEGIMWKKLLEFLSGIDKTLVEGIDPENVLEEQAIKLLKRIAEEKENPEQLVERLGFYSKAIDNAIDLVEQKKNDEALKLLNALKEKLMKYGYAYPVDKEAGKYGYPYAKESHIKSFGFGKYGNLYQMKENKPAPQSQSEPKPKDTPPANQNVIDELSKKIGEMEKNAAVRECKALLSEVLSSADIPKTVKEKIRTRFDGKVFKAEEIQEAIADWKDALAKLSESGEVKGLGEGVNVIYDEADKIQTAMDKMIDLQFEDDDKSKGIPAFRGLLEAYRVCHPNDPDVTGSVKGGGRLTRLTEAITTADFSYALGVSMTRKAVKMFKLKPFIFTDIVTEVPVTNFKQQERVKWGGLSRLPTIAEDGPYTDIGEPKDEEATYSPATKGGFVSVSRRTIKNDDLNFVRRLPSMAGRAARKTLEWDVINLLLSNSTYTPHNRNLFTTAKGNYSTSNLSYDNLTTRKNAMWDQKERGSMQDSGTATAGANLTITDTSKSWTTNAFATYYVRLVYGTGAGQTRVIASNTATAITISTAWTVNPSTDTLYEVSRAANDDEVIGLEAAHIYYGKALDGMVNALINTDRRPDTAEWENNQHYKSLKPHKVPQIAGSTYQYYWFLAADKSDVDLIEIGFVDGQKEPQLVIQDQAALGEVFTNDRIRYRVRHEYGLTVIEYVGLDGNFGTGV